MDILSLLFSKLGAIGAGILAVLALWFYGKHQKVKRVEAEAKVEVAETTLEVKDEIAKREEKVDAMSPDDVIDYFGGVRRGSDPGKTTPTK